MQAVTVLRTAAAALATLGVVGVASANHPSVSTNLGTPVHADIFDRQIEIGPATKWASVRREETIKFVVIKPDGSNASFVWQFDTRGRPPVDLGAIAPGGMLSGRDITVYVKPGLYDRGR